MEWEEERDVSTFSKINHTVYNQFIVNLPSIINKSIYNKNYETLLIHLLVYVKTDNYFRNMKYGFKELLHFITTEQCLKTHWKELTSDNKGPIRSTLFELKHLIKQLKAKNNNKYKNSYTREELYEEYERVHLNFLNETF